MAKPRGDLQLAIGYWFVTHKQQFRNWWAILLLSFLGLSTVWVVIFFTIWIPQQAQLDTAVAKSAQAIQQFRPGATLAPQALTVGPATLLTRDAQHIDLVAIVTNPNTDWGADMVQYRFVVDGTPLPVKTAFVNPGATRPIIELNQARTGQAATLEVIQTHWQRASAAVLPPPNFQIGKTEIKSATVQLGEQSFLTIRFTAEITNRSVYNFLKVRVPIIIKQQDTIVAVDEQPLDRWQTLASKTVTATWPFAIPAASQADVEPQVSQFDADNLY